MSRERILLADDSQIILNHVMDLLRADYQIIGTVTDGNSVCAEVAKLKPDVIVLDISLGERSGIEIAERLCRQGYAGKIVFLSVHEDPDFVGAAIGAGGRGYVFKSRMKTDLGAALTAVLTSRLFISPRNHDGQEFCLDPDRGAES